MPLLNVKNLSVEYPSRRGIFKALHDVNFAIDPGEILGVVGESGAGKSTIGYAVTKLLSPPGHISGGQIFLQDQDLVSVSTKDMVEIRGAKVGFIFQDPMTSLNPVFTIEFQMVETIKANFENVGDEEAYQRAIGLLKQVGIPEPELRIKQYPHQFSGGMRQRVVIAIALAGEPDLIIADEPTTALDVSIQDQILELIIKLCKERDVAVMFVTHDMGVISKVSDRVLVMYRGQLVEQGPAKEVLYQPQHPYTKSLISAVPRGDQKFERFPVVDYIEDGHAGHKRAIDLQTHFLGQDCATETCDDENILTVENLSVRFETKRSLFKSRRRYVQAAKDVSFSIPKGEIFGLVGESGSGKSTVARIIAGLQKADSGSVKFFGFDRDQASSEEQDRLHRHVQMIFQNPYSSLNPRMRVGKIIAEPIRYHRLLTDKKEVHEVVLDLLDHVGLSEGDARKYPHEFSGGQRQRISIARALASRPRFLICDEPTSALDVSVQAQILNLLKDLREELGLTMLFISHDLPVIRQVCDRVAVMYQGEIQEIAETEALFTNPQSPYTQKLLALMPHFNQCA